MASAPHRRESSGGRSLEAAGLARLLGSCLESTAALLRGRGAAAPADVQAALDRGRPSPGDGPPPQIARLSEVVERTARHGARAEQCHENAGLRIDAALYELEQLRHELEAVVDPALLAGTSRILAEAGGGEEIASAAAAPASDPVSGKSGTEVTAAPAAPVRSAA